MDPGDVSDVAPVVDDVEAEDSASLPSDVPVAEVPPEKFSVGGLIEVTVFADGTEGAAWGLSSRKSAALVETPPTPNGLDRDPMRGRVLSASDIPSSEQRKALSTVD